MGAVIGGGSLGGGGVVINEGINLKAAGYYCRIYHESPHI